MEYSYELTTKGKKALENPDIYEMSSDEQTHLFLLFDDENVMAHGYILQPSEKEVVESLARKGFVDKKRQPPMQRMF